MSTPSCVENLSKVQQCHPWISSNARCSITSRTRGRPHGNTSLLEMFSSSLSKTNHKQYFLKQFLNNLKNNQTINLKLVFIKVHFVSFWKISISLTNMDNVFRIERISSENIAPIEHKMARNDLNVIIWPISIGILLLLRSFWVVTWLLTCDNFEFGAKIGQKWPTKAPDDQKWPECLKSDIRNHLHWISASLVVILSGHMTSLRPSWV